MSDINRAIALSDLHLGTDKSYLHSTSSGYEKNKKALGKLLKKFGSQDELILNGDILELSLAGHDEVCQDAEAFFALLAGIGHYKKIVFIPGNHDHHFWRELGEEVHVNSKIRSGLDPPDNYRYPCCFVDERFSTRDKKLQRHILLKYLWPTNRTGCPEIVVKYPHHLARVSSNNGSGQYYLFTHGHFLEDLFKPVNYLITPHHLEELEAFNNLWLELFDYHLGHAGILSDTVKKLEEGYKKGDREAKKAIMQALKSVCYNLTECLHLSWWQGILLNFGLRFIIRQIPLEKKSGLNQAPIDDKLKSSITEYIDTYIIRRYRKGKSKEYFFPCDEDIPTPFTFIFGHTHRVLENNNAENGKIEINGKSYPLFNTGGWLRTDGNGRGENAGVLVIDRKGIRWESLAGKLE